MTVTTSTMSEKGRAALAYAERFGWHVFPCYHITDAGHCSCGNTDCSSPGKHPITPSGFKNATSERVQIREWWTEYPDANIGIPTGELSGFDVLDIDSRHGGDDALEDLVAEVGALPDTVEALTPSGGRHILFQRHPGVRNRTGIRSGIDVRGEGGYIVVAPSNHINGTYHWEDSSRPGEVPLAEWPAALLKVVLGDRERYQQPAAPIEGRIPEGGRNAALTSLAGTMRRRGMSETAIEVALLAENRRRCDPPLSDEEVGRIAASVCRYAPDEAASTPSTSGAVPPFSPTDDGNADRLIARHGQDLRYCPQLGWMVWDGRRWAKDHTGEVRRRAVETVKAMGEEAAADPDRERSALLFKYVARSLADAKIKAMIASAESKLPLPTPISAFDRDPMLFNCLNGTLDLRTGELRPHCREDLITKLAPVEYNPQAECRRWRRFLRRIFADRGKLIEYVQRAVGYGLTGSTAEQVFFYLYGTGANGKSTFLEVLREIWGDYARQSDFNAFILQKSDGPRNDLARLVGARLVVASEAESGRRLAEATIKQLTGGDMITARFLHKEFFEFAPLFKIILSANHKLIVKGTDHAIWRRFKMIPFTETIPIEEQDKDLKNKLREEWPGILAWAVQGCLQWQQHGLGEPDEVREATGAYREEMDQLAGFLTECFEKNADGSVKASELYAAYKQWCEENGEHSMSQRALGLRLAEKGHQKRKTKRGIYYSGLKIYPERVNHRAKVNDSEPFSTFSHMEKKYKENPENRFTKVHPPSKVHPSEENGENRQSGRQIEV